MSLKYDVIIIGAGAAGMMCAIEAGKRGRKVLLIEHSKKLVKRLEFLVVEGAILQTFIPIQVNLFLITLSLLNRH